MNDETRQNLIWGWLRMILGVLQMTLAPLALLVLLTLGAKDYRTWIMVILTTSITAISRLLYGGRSDPRLSKRE